MWLGGLKFYEEVINDISFVKGPIKALGVYFGHDKTECSKLNWQNKIENCKNTIQIWKKRKLTMIGRSQIIKSLLLPKFTFLAQ